MATEIIDGKRTLFEHSGREFELPDQHRVKARGAKFQYCEPRRGRAHPESASRGDAASELMTALAPAAAPA
jgi:hypothetical protein